ncbi:hypothetical protein MUN82_21385 [Hymenobacter aerilatus]|uniref:Uncharacterized protein n=1 Tax=Hymenobacter aerilatus TaxID=2932251 RepID=A0A8T9T036_9BACT|nr:hypothetical protein [Hymenobacter aerilatus]UOR05466.1 hypothetical protein MUN82_21385 [Hymenobacter aerilatus]
MLSFTHSHDHSLRPLPPATYTQLAPALSALGMATQHFFQLPTAAPAQEAITTLTRLDGTAVAQLAALASTPELEGLIATYPLRLYDYVLLGRAALGSPLGAAVRAYLRQQMQLSDEELERLFAYCLQLSAELENALEQFLAGPSGAAALAPLRRRQQQIQAVFAQYETSLLPALPPAATLGFDEGRLQLLRLALLLTQELRHTTAATHPFLQALPSLTALSDSAMEAITARLRVVEAGERLPLSLPELVLLYQVLHVCALAFVSDVLGTVGLEDALPLADHPVTPTPGSSRQAVAALATGFIGWVDREFGQEPIVQQARQEVAALAELLG